LSGRRDVIVVASVSCLYGMGNPEAFNNSVVDLKVGEIISRQALLHKFVNALYARTTAEFKRGSFRVKGDAVDIFPAYAETFFRISFWGDEVESIEHIDPISGSKIENMSEMRLFPANLFVTEKDQLQNAIHHIQDDLMSQVDHFNQVDRRMEAKRLEERTNFDLEMIRELGYCSGIENYSRYLDGRAPGVRPF